MSVSMQSENSKDDIEPEEVELEDIVWNLMSRSGLLSQIQGQISKFIEDNGKAENVDIIQGRADGKILGLIFEYLQWIGMKQTNSVLMSESPVGVDVSIFESKDRADPEYRPELCRILDDLNITEEEEDKGSPTRSHNYSRDEFEDSKLTSESGHNEKHKESFNEGKDNHGEANVSLKEIRQAEKNASPNNGEERGDAIENPIEDFDEGSLFEDNPSFTSTPNKSLNASLEKGEQDSDNMINFNSPIIKGLDHSRPHVTLRQKLDVNLDPFQSPVGTPKSGRLSMGANFTGLNPQPSISDATKHLEEIQSNIEEEENSEASKDNESVHSDKPEPERDFTKVDFKLEAKSSTKYENDDEKQNESLKNDVPLRSLDDDSTSDFMETLTMEEDTQDISIASDSKGMSSCEHAVSLK
ncbi:unnamed protein product [Orchesella dallaii]|uniref:LisH domain-containing protein n=1 Tax=Orchesella dallaii TaxID=48710 RepID=A0ABP1QN30_9HEXA